MTGSVCEHAGISGFDGADRRALIAGAVTLGALSIAYPVVAESAARPLAVFVLPALLTAVLGGWRPTVLIGAASLAVAVVLGLAGPLGAEALTARWTVIGLGVLMGAIGAAVREGQRGRLAEMDEVLTLRAAFERALAPAPVAPEGFLAAARYRPAESRLQLGGDFLEAVARPDGRLAVLIGDVCGHGPREAAFGAALRAGWKSIALAGGEDPAEWVKALNASFFLDGRLDTYATLCTGYLDVHSDSARLINLGHPPPVVLEHPPRLLDLPPAPPLGLHLPDHWVATDVEWTGSPVLFFTDGLIENPCHDGPPRRWGIDGLLDWLDDHQLTPSVDSLDVLVDAASADRDIRDDVAVLLVAADHREVAAVTLPGARRGRPGPTRAPWGRRPDSR